MEFRAVKADFVYVLRNWSRSRGSVLASLVMPIVLLLTLGFIFGAKADTHPVLLVEDADGGAAAERLLATLQAQDAVEVRLASPGDAAIASWLTAERGTAFLRVPPGFSDRLASGENATVEVTLAGNGGDARLVDRVVQDGLAAADNRSAPVARASATKTVVQGARDVPYSSYLLPGIIGLNALSVGLSNSFSSVLQLRHQGLLARLAVSPMRKSEWLLGRMLGQTVITLVGTVALVLCALLVFRADVTVTPLSVVLIVVATLVFAGVGTVIGGMLRRPDAAGTIINLVSLPIVLVSGTFFDPSILPEFLSWVPALSPLKHLNDGLRGEMLGAGGHEAGLFALAILGALAVVVLVLGARTINWTKKD